MDRCRRQVETRFSIPQPSKGAMNQLIRCLVFMKSPPAYQYVLAREFLRSVTKLEWDFRNSALMSLESKLPMQQRPVALCIPAAIECLEKTTKIEMSRLSGVIPKEIGNLERLVRLELSGGDLCGPIPDEAWELCGNQDLRMLNILDLSENQLDGPIPSWIGNLTLLTTLSLELKPTLRRNTSINEQVHTLSLFYLV
ncbi:hypothetical protein BDR26DRAFT_867861 [Obelidium mucronatum]|nr:hypothetical protein BDR26DRAFT_867861 [Obelidium mucronatum]